MHFFPSQYLPYLLALSFDLTTLKGNGGHYSSNSVDHPSMYVGTGTRACCHGGPYCYIMLVKQSYYFGKNLWLLHYSFGKRLVDTVLTFYKATYLNQGRLKIFGKV